MIKDAFLAERGEFGYLVPSPQKAANRVNHQSSSFGQEPSSIGGPKKSPGGALSGGSASSSVDMRPKMRGLATGRKAPGLALVMRC